MEQKGTAQNVSIIIPFYKGEAYIDACLESILNNTDAFRSIIIVDNGPTPFELNKIKNNKIKILRTKAHIGFGRACNAGVYTSMKEGDDFAIILNQDAVFAKDSIRNLILPFSHHPQLFATVPISYNYDLKEIDQRTFNNYVAPIKKYISDKNNNNIQDYYLVNNKQLNGACVAFDLKKVKEVGLFDPIIFMYGEETELFRRVEFGYDFDLALMPKAKIGHVHSNLVAEGKKREKISNWIRHSKQIYLLKMPKENVLISFFRIFKYTLHTYLIALKELKLNRWLVYIKSDFDYLKKIRTIISNKKSDNLKKMIQEYLERDIEIRN